MTARCHSLGAPLRHEVGLSLVELMVALVIASLLGIGIVQIFGGTRAAFNTNSAVARAQENSRFAIGFIENDLRMVGHLGLTNEQGYLTTNIFNHLSPDGRSNSTNTPFLYRMHISVQGYGFIGTDGFNTLYTMLDEPDVAASAAAWSPALPSELGIEAKALAGSDVLLLRFLSAENVPLKDISADATVAANIDLSGKILWDNTQPGSENFMADGGVFALTNYTLMSLFYANPALTDTALAPMGAGGNNQVGWPAIAGRPDELDYGRGSSLYKYEVSAYYIALGADGQPALWRRRLGADGKLLAPEELVPGVEMMQVTYGVVTADPRRGDQPTRYLTAQGIEGGSWRATSEARWADVVSVRVGLLMRGNLPSGTAQEVNFERNVGGMRIMPPEDRRLRHVYETQVALRNRNRG